MTLPELKPWLAFGLLAVLLLWETAAPFLLFPKGRARLAHGAINMLLGIRLEQLALYEVLLIAWVQFQHANFSLGARADRVLSWLFVTPIMHKIHHSHWQPETDSNYSSLLSVWDRIFRSFRTTPDPAKLRLGLDEFADDRSQTLLGILGTPLIREGVDQ